MRILLVDDSSTMRRIQKNTLEKLGHTDVTEAGDGLEAIAKLTTAGPFDLVLMDWSMPNMGGLELLKWVRTELKAAPQPIIILCTAQGNFEDIQNAILFGANEYIVKPFTNEIIKNKLELLGLI